MILMHLGLREKKKPRLCPKESASTIFPELTLVTIHEFTECLAEACGVDAVGSKIFRERT